MSTENSLSSPESVVTVKNALSPGQDRSGVSPLLICLVWMLATTATYVSYTYVNLFHAGFDLIRKNVDRGLLFQGVRFGIFLAVTTLVLLYVKKGAKRKELFQGVAVYTALFWLAMTARNFYGIYAGESSYRGGFFSALGTATYQSTFIVLLAVVASMGIPPAWRKVAYYLSLVPPLLLSLMFWIRFYPFLFAGKTGRGYDFLAHFHEGHRGQLVYLTGSGIALTGSVATLLVFWGWSENKLRTWMFCLLYAMGSVWVPFGASRTNLLAYILGHVFILIFSNFKSRRYWWFGLLFLLLFNAFIFISVGTDNSDWASNINKVKTMIKDAETLQHLSIAYENRRNNIEEPSAPEPKENTETNQDVKAKPEILAVEEPSISLEPMNENLEMMNENLEMPPERPKIPTEQTEEEKKVEEEKIIAEEEEKQKKQELLTKVRRAGSGRMGLWVDCVERIIDHPLLGYGHSPYKTIAPTARPSRDPALADSDPYIINRYFYPHNALLEAYLMTGVIGGTLFLAMLCVGLKDLWTCMRYCPEMGWIGVLTVTCLMSAMFILRPTAPILWFCLISLHAVAVEHRREKHAENTPE